MPRLFDITPLVSTTRYADGTIEHDNRLMYALSDEAATAFNAILEAYGGYAALYMESLELRSPGFQIWVALRQEYDIADYVMAQRAKIGGADTFKSAASCLRAGKRSRMRRRSSRSLRAPSASCPMSQRTFSG